MVNVFSICNFIVYFDAICALSSLLIEARMLIAYICFYLQCTSYLLNANGCNISMFLAVVKVVIASEVFCTWKDMEKVGTFVTFLLLLRTDDLWKEGFATFKSCFHSNSVGA